jgi:phosphotransferase system HPr-like phosphotransfer protein
MKNKTIKINGISDITSFIREASKVDGDVLCTKGRYTVDGKSILGLMSFDTSTGFEVEYPASAYDFDTYLERFDNEE